MSNKSRIILARVMIFCSVILIGSGVYLNLQETKPIIDPVSDVTTPDNDSVIITTNDGMPPTATNDNDSDKTGNSDNATAVPNDSTSSDTPVPNNTTTSGNTGNTSSTGNTSGTNTNSTPSPSPAPEPEPEPAPVVDQNVIFRKSIEAVSYTHLTLPTIA